MYIRLQSKGQTSLSPLPSINRTRDANSYVLHVGGLGTYPTMAAELRLRLPSSACVTSQTGTSIADAGGYYFRQPTEATI